MDSEEKTNSDQPRTAAQDTSRLKPEDEKQILQDQSSEREATFLRRALLQWSVPAIVAITLPQDAHAQGSPHSDHTDHADHADVPHSDHTDAHADAHTDSHIDVHTDVPAPHVDAPHVDSN